MLVENTRFGRAEFTDIREHEIMERPEFKEIRSIKSLKDKAFNQLGSSGGGNHFVDIGIVDFADDALLSGIPKGRYMAVLSHSGSRSLGAEIATYYTKIAKEKRLLPAGATNLAWLDFFSEEGMEYWKAMNLAGAYSSANHHIIHKKIADALGLIPLKMIENHHNFAWLDELNNNECLIIHRKGATPANLGDIGIIPGSMTSPGYIVIGKGEAESLYSAAHGAGRVFSRTKAKTLISAKELKQVLQNANVELIGGSLDEAPAAYKDITKVMQYQKDLVNIIGTFYPKIVRMEGGM